MRKTVLKALARALGVRALFVDPDACVLAVGEERFEVHWPAGFAEAGPDAAVPRSVKWVGAVSAILANDDVEANDLADQMMAYFYGLYAKRTGLMPKVTPESA